MRQRSSPHRLVPACLGLLVAGCGGLPGMGGSGDGGATETVPTVEVDLEGVESAAAENVRAHLSIASEPCDAPEWRVRRRMRRLDEEGERAMRALGYYEARVSGTLEREEECWRARVSVEPGVPVRVDDVRFELVGPGEQDPRLATLGDDLPIRTGAILDHGRYEAAKRAVVTQTRTVGYLDGRFRTSRIEVEPAAHRAEVELVFETGRRYDFGTLDVRQDVLDPDLVDRLVRWREGRPYDARELIELRRVLGDSGWFADTDVRPRLDERDDGQVPVDVTASPAKRHGFTAGIGATTDTGPRVRLGYENRRLNRRGHRWSARTLASIVQQEATAAYRLPLDDPRTEWLSLEGGLQRKDTDTSESVAAKLAARQTALRFGTWFETRSVELSREDFTVGGEDGTSTLVVPGIGWSRTSSDRDVDPDRGWRLTLDLSATHEAIGSDVAFARALIAGKWLQRVPGGGRVITRADIGGMAVDVFRRLPPSQRFFAGGDTSVRGYGFEELGPRDADGEVIGGRYLLAGSLEYEHPVAAQWAVAAFVDAGNAFDDDSFDDGLNVGIGLGVRWRSPIGPVRVDLAHPLDDDRLVRLHLRLGPDL